MTQSLYTTSQIRQLEQLMIDHGISAHTMMCRAAEAVLNNVGTGRDLSVSDADGNGQKDNGRTGHDLSLQSLVVFCGSGNNGGDGYQLAKLAQQQGYQVQVRFIGD